MTPSHLIGYTDGRCDDSRGQYYNGLTRRAMVVRADGTERREVGGSLITRGEQSTQFAGWWPDGKQMNLLSMWESEENALWEREHGDFRIIDGHWLVDSCLVDLETDVAANLTAVARVSCYNVGMAPVPGDPSRIGFSAIVNRQSRPFAMDPDGRHKRPVEAAGGFIYGIAVSPDGKRAAYHADYKLYLAEGDGSNAVRIDSGNPFDFLPTWSPDSKWILFNSGPDNRSHNPCLVAADGTGFRKLADRGGYEGVMEMLDHPDFHSSSSDLPIWSMDSQWVYFTARVGKAIELLRISIDGAKTEQITESDPDVCNFHPKSSPDGEWLVFGSTRDGARALYVARADGSELHPITEPRKGRAQAHAHWQPSQTRS